MTQFVKIALMHSYEMHSYEMHSYESVLFRMTVRSILDRKESDQGSLRSLDSGFRRSERLNTSRNLLNEEALRRDIFGVCNAFSSNSSVSGISSVFSLHDF